MRIILYTGKGGVGKTSVAAATALRCAELGYKTIVLSTDAAHSLGDSFDVTLSNEPKLMAPNLWAQEADMSATIETYWSTIHEWMSALLAWRGMERILADEMAILPGMEELASLLYITHYHDGGDHDVIIADMAPTGETLRLLSFPEVLHWWMERLFPIERTAANILRPLVKPFTNIPFPDDSVFEAAKNLFGELDRMRLLLSDPSVSSVRLVVNPEKMVIREAQRTYTYLNLYGYHTDLVVCNRVIPEAVDDEYFSAWKEAQGKNFHVIEESFSPIPILPVPLFREEVMGATLLRQMAERIFGEKDPSRVFYQGCARQIQKEDGHYTMTLPLPFVTKKDISLVRNGDELIIHVGSQKRNVFLPRTLSRLPTTDAKFEDGKLKIRFAAGG
ncbi:MAG: ArsA family ATPase [Chloroflexi bacterium]|nr:ArsA family ATPase [Chloroflexota bacterium]